MAASLIFAGGTGQRMNTSATPKQFLGIHGKPVIVYTVEQFEAHPEIESIVVVCLKSWIDKLKKYLDMYRITKVIAVIPGGNTAHASIHLGLQYLSAHTWADGIVLIHDGVRPFITKGLITANIAAAKQYGNAITAEAARESVLLSRDANRIDTVSPRECSYISKAPQSFLHTDILKLYNIAQRDGIVAYEPAHLLSLYGAEMHLVPSTPYNIKITDPADYYIFKALYEMQESRRVFGL